MASLIPGYEYDIFISYRQKDNKHDGWVTGFVDNLKGELESTFKEDISIYFDENPHDGLLETHDVDASLKEKLKCLIFMPIISRTYCDPKSFAWEHEFKTFVGQASQDQFGLKIRLPNGNVANRVLPVRIHDLDNADIMQCESLLGGVMRGVDFIYKSPGVNRPLLPKEENPQENQNHTSYRDQINKIANAVKEIISGLKSSGGSEEKIQYEDLTVQQELRDEEKISDRRKRKIGIAVMAILVLFVGSLVVFQGLFRSKEDKKIIEKSIAVLPFANLSNDPEQEFFVDGMVDEILDRLFKVGDMKVISRTSSMRYKNTTLSLKEIAHELGVSAVLEGSVRKIGNDVHITVQLIDAKTDTHLWSDTFEGNLTDAFAFQSNVALGVARKLKAILTAKETTLIRNAVPTTNQTAYNFYLKGNEYSNILKTDSALLMYTKAIQEDPMFAGAYAKRAKAHMYRYWTKHEGWQGHDLEAREDIKMGLKLNPELIDLKMTEAFGLYQLDRKYDDALKILAELKTKAPNIADLYAYTSYIFRRQGKFEESIIEAKRSIQLDPFHASYINILSETYQLLHQYDNEIENARQGLTVIPDFKGFINHIFMAYLSKTGDLKVALKESGLTDEDAQYEIYYYNKEYDKLIDFLDKDSSVKSDQTTYQPQKFRLALIYYLKGDKPLSKIYADSAIMNLDEKIKEDPADDRFYATLGKCYAFKGDVQRAIINGEKAVDLKPIKLDAYQGVYKEQDLMEIYLLTGNYDIALDKVEYLLSIPSWLSVGILTIDPIFDSLRDLPRFQKIIRNASK